MSQGHKSRIYVESWMILIIQQLFCLLQSYFLEREIKWSKEIEKVNFRIIKLYNELRWIGSIVIVHFIKIVKNSN